jgi:hypothetical protein
MFSIFIYVLQCEYVCFYVQICIIRYVHFPYMDDDNSNKI